MFLRESNRSTALKTLSLRIRGVKTELEDAGLETEGMAETTAQLQAKLKALTGGKVDILLDADTFKNTTQILREMATVWEDMTDMEQAAALELLGGKRQANILSSLISNFETVEDVIETSANSSGSAMAENAKWLDSIEGKTYQFTNALETMWSNMLDSEVVKGLIDFGTKAIQFLDTTPGKITAVLAALAGFAKFKGFNPLKMLSEIGPSIKNLSSAQTMLNALSQSMPVSATMSTAQIQTYAATVSDLTVKQQAAMLASKGFTEAQITQALVMNGVDEKTAQQIASTTHLNTVKQASVAVTKQQAAAILEENGVQLSDVAATWLATEGEQALTREKIASAIASGALRGATAEDIAALYGLAGASNTATFSIKGLATAMWTMVKANPLGWIISAVSLIGMLATSFKSAEDEMGEAISKANQIKSEFNSVSSTIESNIKTVKGLEDEFTELSKCVDENGNNISLSTKDYERYKEIVGQIVNLTPGVVEGYNAEGEAIINKNKLLERSIELMQEEQKIEARKYSSAENWKTLAEGLEAEIANAPSKETTANKFGKRVVEMIAEENIDWYNWLATDAKNEGGSGVQNFLKDMGLSSGWESAGTDINTVLSYVPLLGQLNSEFGGLAGYEEDYANLISENALDILKELKENENKYVGSDAYFTQEQYDELVGYLTDYYNADNKDDTRKRFQSQYTDLLLNATKGTDAYYELNDQELGFLKKYINTAFTIPEDGNITGALSDAQEELFSFVEKLSTDEELQVFIPIGYSLQSGLDEDGNPVSVTQYQAEISKFVERVKAYMASQGYDGAVIDAMLGTFGTDTNGSLSKDVQDAIDHVNRITTGSKLVEISSMRDRLTTDELLYIKYNISAEPGSMTLDELIAKMNQMKDDSGVNVVPVKTYSEITSDVESYNDVLKQTEEILHNDIQVTQECKDSLKELGISEEDLNKCFYENNKMVVKNADALNDLIEKTKKSTDRNAKLAKSQAALEYYELYKELKDLTRGTEVTDKATLDYIDSLYDQMGALQKTISKYSLLEAELLGVANAYSEIEEAQAADEAKDYGSKAENLVNVLGDAINSRELGTEAAQVAIQGLVPEEIYKDLNTADEKMDAIYKYFTNGPISQLFTIKFDDEGIIENVEMTEENLKKYIDNSDVFNGTWDNFTMDSSIQNMEDFMEATGMTKEVAFAFLSELEKYDLSWLNGNYGTMMDQLMGDNIEYQLYSTTQALADLEYKLAHGKITAEEYAKEYQRLSDIQSENVKNARDNAGAWISTTDELEKQKDALVEQQKALKEAKEKGEDTSKIEENIKTITKDIETLTGDLQGLNEPSKIEIQASIENVQSDIKAFKEDIEKTASPELKAVIAEIDEAGFENLGLKKDSSGKWKVDMKAYTKLDPLSQGEVQKYLDLMNEEYTLKVSLGEDFVTVEEHLADIVEILEKIYEIQVGVDDTGYQNWLSDFLKAPLSKKITMVAEGVTGWFSSKDENAASVNGTAHVRGTAYSGGSWGAAKTETSLVGELGPEILVRGNSWTTVGENGAEFTQVKKGDIIFNHKQSKQLLENGHVTSRGKAYAGGTAYAGIGSKLWEHAQNRLSLGTGILSNSAKKAKEVITPIVNGVVNGVKEQLASKNTSSTKSAASTIGQLVDTWGSALAGSANLAGDYGNKDDSSGSGTSEDEFEETFDWFEVKLEEVAEDLDLLSAQLENCATYTDKNAKVQELMAKNVEKQDWLKKGIKLYDNKAASYLKDIPSKYHDMVKNGAVAIEDFVGKTDEATLEAIQNYRDYAQKSADLTQQLEESITELRDLAIQKIDNVEHSGSVRATVEASQTEKLQNAVDFDETRGLITDPNYYAAMMENSERTISYLTTARQGMQKEFDQAVRDGQLKVGSDEWYENLNKLYKIDAQIDKANISLEEFQNSINDIYWDNFDQLINRLDYISEDAQGLIDIMSELDMVTKPDNDDGWYASDVSWTKEGMATLGLHAQEMERAEEKAKAYARAIDDLTKEYKAGHYSESEYHEKLNELTQGQYDAIKAAQEEKEAIVELNEQRVDAIKEGIEKQIESYEKLIDAKKKELEAEKD